MRILHLLAQRPGLTGSGVYLQSIVRLADAEAVDRCFHISDN
ncbi:MAG: hypothetical protein P9X26_01330 [Candidatus Stygibacter frigidus]|nr:hypothetical protein [Candidatus Stygibacter frigidus]